MPPSERRSSSKTAALSSLASTSGPLGAFPTRRRHTPPIKDDDSQDGSEDAHPTKLANLNDDDEHGLVRPNTSDTQQPTSRPILLSNGKHLKSSLKASSSLPTIEFPQEHHTHHQRARSASPPYPESSLPPLEIVQTSRKPASRPILLSNGKPLKSSLKSSSSSVPPRSLVPTFPQQHHTHYHYQRARSDFDPPSPPNPGSPTSSPPPQKDILSNGKPLKSSLKSSTSSVPPRSLVPTISFSQRHNLYQRAPSYFDRPSPSPSPSPNPEPSTSSLPPRKNVQFSYKLNTVQLFNKSGEPASLFQIERHTDDLSLPVLWGRSWNRTAADPFPKLDRSFSLSPPPFPCGPSTTAQVMDALRHTDEEFLSTMAAFIRHIHAHSRSPLASSIEFIYDLANTIVGLVGRLLTLSQAVMLHPDTPTNRVNNLMLAKEELYNVTISLAVYVRSLTVSLSSSILEETERQILLPSVTGTVQAGADCVAVIKVCLACSTSDLRFIIDLPSPMLIPAVSNSPAVNSVSGPGDEDHTFQVQTSSQRHSPWHSMNSDKLYQSTRLNDWILESSVSMMPQIEEEDASSTDGLPSAQKIYENKDCTHPTNALTTHLGIRQRKTSDPVEGYKTWTDVSSEENHVQTEICPHFSVRSFELPAKGLSSDIIVTVGMPPVVPTEMPFTSDTWIPSPTRSIQSSSHSTPSFIDASPDDFSDGAISEYPASCSYSMFETTSIRSWSGKLDFGIESEQGSPSDEVVGNWETFSMISRETFETAQEPPPELLLALGLHRSVSHQTPLSTADELSPSPSLKGVSIHEGSSHEESVNLISNSKASALYNTSFIRDVSNVCIKGSRINFTTNIVHHHEDVRVGLHTLYLRSDPTALHNSYERQKGMYQQMKAMRTWGSQLLISSSFTLGEYPLSVPCIKTCDLEEVVNDVFTWLYSASSPYSIMWLSDEYEGNSRTSLIGHCLASFLGDRHDLTASYFYTHRTPGTSYSGADRKDGPSGIIPTLAYQLTRHIPEIEMPIALTAANDLYIFDLSLDEQMKKLIVDPLLALPKPCKFPQLFLIHALEDCDDDDFQELFLRAFGKSLSLLQQQSVPQKLMLLGRHTPQLGKYFLEPEMQEIVRHRLLPISQDV